MKWTEKTKCCFVFCCLSFPQKPVTSPAALWCCRAHPDSVWPTEYLGKLGQHFKKKCGLGQRQWNMSAKFMALGVKQAIQGLEALTSAKVLFPFYGLNIRISVHLQLWAREHKWGQSHAKQCLPPALPVDLAGLAVTLPAGVADRPPALPGSGGMTEQRPLAHSSLLPGAAPLPSFALVWPWAASQQDASLSHHGAHCQRTPSPNSCPYCR